MEAVATVVMEQVFKAAKFGFSYLRKKLDFLLDYESNGEGLDSRLLELTNRKENIEHRLKTEEMRRMYEPIPEVAKWLENVEKETKTIIDWKQRDQKCSITCVNWRNRYKLNKEVKEKDSEVKKLIAEVHRFEKLDITTPPLPPSVVHKNIPGFLETDSSKFLLQIIKELRASESVKSIGVWGMGGVGKTTLLKNLNNQLESDPIFDKVIFLTISDNPIWKKIQKEIAEKIGLTDPPDYEDADMRVNMLSKALGKTKIVLFILDDVWTKFELSLLGISNETSNIKHKIIITTRYKSVCDQMGVGEREQFELKPMSKDDSWRLFQAQAGFVANLQAIEPIAIKLCDKCGGSPLAICTFASSLSGDTNKKSWNCALRALGSSDQTQLSDVFMPIFRSIEFSFNRLSSEDVKLCFLYCCSSPNDNVTSLSDMRIYCISRKLISGRILRNASELVEAFVEELRKSSLLHVVHGYGYESSVRLHDVVRQVGLLIASKKYGFVIKSGQQLGMHDMSFNNQPNHISLSHSKIDKLPHTLCCPSLLALDMHDMSFNNQPEIQPEFFAKTTKLHYLDISRIGISNLPNSLYELVHLCALDMRGLKNLVDISSIDKLKCLEILILDDTGIEELPNELGNLDILRMLQLNNTLKLKRVPSNVLKKLSGLQELIMENSFNQWELNGENGVNASLSQIFGLSQLTTLHLNIINPLCLEHDYIIASLSNLEKFRIVVSSSGDVVNADRRFMRYLSLSNIPFRFSTWICKFFEKSEYVNLNGSDVVENLPFHQIMGFDRLIELRISKLGLMKNVIDCRLRTTGYGNDVFRSLERLVIQDMNNLESVCNIGSITRLLFSKLTHIQIHNCQNLQILFMGSMDQALQNLTNIQIHNCDRLKAFTDVDGPCYFQKLKEIEVINCGNLEIILNAEADWECLETISVIECWNLVNIYHKSSFPQNLKHLTLMRCEKLNRSLSSLIQRSFLSIETIKVIYCNPGNVEYLLSTNEIDKPLSKNVFENLKLLAVVGFDGKGIFHGPISIFSLKNLVEVHIADCNDLTSIWGSCETFALLNPLKIFVIGWCDKLMLNEVFLPQGMGDEISVRAEHLYLRAFSEVTTLAFLPEASLQYVQTLKVLCCKNLKYLLPQLKTLTQLEYLVIYSSPKLLTLEPEEEMIPYPSTQWQGRLESIQPAFTQTTFINIIFLLIGDCHHLKNIFSVSIARSLVFLKELSVVNCNEMTEIVALSDSVENEVVYADLFPRLRIVNLFWLPQLECFIRRNPTPLIFGSLEVLSVWESPNFVTLGMGSSSAPSLRRIEGKEEWFHNFEKELSFYSGLSSLFLNFSYSHALHICSIYDDWIEYDGYKSKLRGSQCASLLPKWMNLIEDFFQVFLSSCFTS